MRRRTFLTQIAGGALVADRALANSLPAVPFGKTSVTRLILGGNPFRGFSHSTRKLDDLMRNYFTVQRSADLLLHAEEQGINTFQSSYAPIIRDAINRAREQGSKIQWICLTDAGQEENLKDILALKPIAISHHGNRTDEAFQSGNAHKVLDYVKKVHDLGYFAGISTHSPHVVERIEDSGWENDFYMTCLYYLTRTQEPKLVDKEEPFVAGDPTRMCEKIRAVKKICLAFKLLAAGRACWTQAGTENAFKFAYSNIKNGDACIVGMFPILNDEVRENVGYARKYARRPA